MILLSLTLQDMGKGGPQIELIDSTDNVQSFVDPSCGLKFKIVVQQLLRTADYRRSILYMFPTWQVSPFLSSERSSPTVDICSSGHWLAYAGVIG